jgi:outer membrane protein OmpA-like peptidoglycan-associated protein
MIRIMILILFATQRLQAQVPDSIDASMAFVQVTVTDLKGNPSKGEQILFRSNNSGKRYAGRSDGRGRFLIALPVGTKYSITVKSLTDSTKYGMIDIPAPGPDEVYTEPFTVNVKFEPARQYTLDNVHFDFGKSTIRPESLGELNELVSFLQFKENTRIEIGGHTDNVGNEADNTRLSQQRADAIRAYLIQKNIAADRVVAKGYGASMPVADNTTAEGRQANRRTVVRLL